LSVYVADTVRMPIPVVVQAGVVILPCVTMLAAVSVPAKLALVVAIVPTIVPNMLLPVMSPAALTLPPVNKLAPVMSPVTDTTVPVWLAALTLILANTLPAVTLPEILILVVAIVPVIVPLMFPPVILPDANMLPPTLIPPAPMANAYELATFAILVAFAGALAIYRVAAVVTRVLDAVVANVGWLITCT